MRRRRSKADRPAFVPGTVAPRACARNRGVGDRWRFASIKLREPPEATVRAFTAGDAILREAVVLCWSREDGQVYEARVSFTDDRVLAWDPASPTVSRT